MDLETGKRAVGRIIRLTLGWILMVAGLILGPVPVFPGFLLFLPGLTLVAAETKWIRRLLRRLRERRLIRRAMREAEKVGVNFHLDKDDEPAGGPPSSGP